VSGAVQTPVGAPFPDFELPDLEGRIWQRSDLLDRAVVVFCFSTW
jgi:peroxiredoxin